MDRSLENNSPEHVHPVPQPVILIVLPVTSGVVGFCLVAGLLRRSEGVDIWGTAAHAAAVAVLCAAWIGAPAAHWASVTGWRRFHQWMGLGAGAGALLVIVPFVGHLIGALVRGETSVLDLTWGVLLRMILATLGLSDLLRVRRGLLRIEALPVISGALAGAVFWLVAVRPRWQR